MAEPASSRATSPRDRAPRDTAKDSSRRARIAVAIGALVTFVFFLTTSSAVKQHHTPFNHFALLADAWLHGRFDLGGPPPAYTQNNDFSVYADKVFVSFPPFPALLLLPFVALAGNAEGVRDGLIFVGLSGIGPAFLFLALESLRARREADITEQQSIGLALLFAFGTVYWFSAVQGTVWFAAHVVGVALACIYAWAAIGAERPFIAGLALVLGFATRTPLAFAAPLFLHQLAMRHWKDGKLDREALLPELGRFVAPVSIGLSILFWMNRARFGEALEFGHKYLAIGWRPRIDKWGLASYHYLGRNLAVVLTSLPYTRVANAPFQINAHGLALWVTSPFYAWAVWPKRTTPLFWATALSIACVAAPSLLYQNSGWIQFGYRFSNDYAPFVVLLIAIGKKPLGRIFWSLAALAVLINGFGAVSFQREGWEKFYFVDGTQRILHQPD
jgi:hypothetical protein